MHHQTDEQSSRSEKWLKFSGNVEYVWHMAKNAPGRRAAEVFTETTEEHTVLRPIKRAKIHKSYTVTEKGPSYGKNWSYRASWRGGHVPKFAMRQQRKTWVQSTKEAPRESRCYFSGVSQRRTVPRENLSSFRSTLHNLRHIIVFQRMELITPTKRGSSAKLGTTAVLLLESLRKLTDWTPEVNFHISWKMAENSLLCASLSRVSKTRSSCSTSPTSPNAFSQELWTFYSVSSNNTKWEYEWTSTRRLVTNPVTWRRTSTRKPVTAWIAMRKGVTGKEFTLTSWKTEIAKCRRARTIRTLCKRRTGEAIPRAAKFGRIDNSRAQSLNWHLWIGKQSPNTLSWGNLAA